MTLSARLMFLEEPRAGFYERPRGRRTEGSPRCRDERNFDNCTRVLSIDAGREVETSYRNRPLLSPRRQGELILSFNFFALFRCVQRADGFGHAGGV
jgi:hypothetical protein